jgi:hypothetical protein
MRFRPGFRMRSRSGVRFRVCGVGFRAVGVSFRTRSGVGFRAVGVTFRTGGGVGFGMCCRRRMRL